MVVDEDGLGCHFKQKKMNKNLLVKNKMNRDIEPKYNSFNSMQTLAIMCQMLKNLLRTLAQVKLLRESSLKKIVSWGLHSAS